MPSDRTPPEERLRKLVAELAEADAGHLIEEARAGARARARVVIEEMMVDELFAAAARASATPTDTDAPAQAAAAAPAVADNESQPTESAPSRAEVGEGRWAYCVLAARDAEQVTGLEGVESQPVEVVVEGPLAALVSRVPLAEYGDVRLREHLEDITWLERTARAHEGVLEQMLSRVSIVPLRLCTIYRDDARVCRMLRENHATLIDSLHRIYGALEWGIKVFAPVEHPASAGDRPEREAASGADYLAQRQRQRRAVQQLDALCAECAEDASVTLSQLAREARVNPPQRPEAHGRRLEMILNAAYLVDHARITELEGAVAELAERWEPQGFVVELTGPWPAYNFVSDATGVMT